MNKPDLTSVVDMKISVLLPDGKRWDFVLVDPSLREVIREDLEYMVNNFMPERQGNLFTERQEKLKIDGPYSAGVDHVKIGGVPLRD